MKLITFQDNSGVHLGVLQDGGIVALDAIAPDMLSLIDMGDAGLEQVRSLLSGAPATIALEGVQLLAPIPRPGRTWCASASTTGRM